MRFAFVNGSVVRADGVAAVDVVVDGELIVAVGVGAGAAVEDRRDVAGALIAPGLVDLQINGGWGIDLSREPERVWELAATLVREGVTSFCPTLVSCADDVRRRFLATLRVGPPSDDVARARCLGAHLEGPILNPVRRGAHPATALRSATDPITESWHSPEVRLVTLAPELPGALELVRSLTARGVVVSAGHTDATYDELLAAGAAGVTMVTHLFNAMAPFGHRSPGPIGAVLASGSLVAGLIVDGVHVHPGAVAAAWNALGPDRVCLVTDAVAPLGLVERGVEIRLVDGTLAGSNLHLLDAVRNLMEFTGCTLHDAIRAATANPARAVGADEIGAVDVGRRADLVVLDPEDLSVRATVVGGVPR